MPIMTDKDKSAVKDVFKRLDKVVEVLFFTQEHECQYCSLTRELLDEIASIDSRIQVETLDLVKDAGRAEELGIDKIPAIALIGERDYGIRFYGIPAGYEFTSLLDALVDVSRRDHGLPAEIVEQLAKVDSPVHMQAMVTPTCPYCPQAVRTAHRFAMANDNITGDMVEVSEFPHLAVKYGVQGVPNTIINDTHSVMGGQPPQVFLQEILAALGKG